MDHSGIIRKQIYNRKKKTKIIALAKVGQVEKMETKNIAPTHMGWTEKHS